jgi:hypothetical protein
MINSSSNFKEDTFSRDHNQLPLTFPISNSNPFQLLDNSFPDHGLIVQSSSVKKVENFHISLLLSFNFKYLCF